MGLKMKDKKTKGMIIDGSKPPTMMSQEAIDGIRGVGQCRAHRKKAEARVQCCLLGVVMSQRKVLVRHQSAGGSVQEGQRHMGNKSRKSEQQSADTKSSHQVDSGGGALLPIRVLC